MELNLNHLHLICATPQGRCCVACALALGRNSPSVASVISGLSLCVCTLIIIQTVISQELVQSKFRSEEGVLDTTQQRRFNPPQVLEQTRRHPELHLNPPRRFQPK